ncbi:MAG: PAS domain-containing protein, partial [Waterburya sp.]
MQFKSGEIAQLTKTDFPYGSLQLLESIHSAEIIFDDSNNCLFFNAAAEQILGDRSDISLIGDWIRSQTQDNSQESLIFTIQDLPLNIVIIDEQNIEGIEVLLSKLDVSEEFGQQLNKYKSLSIREP